MNTNFSLPNCIEYDFKELSHGTVEVNFLNHVRSLEKQIICNELFAFLDKESDLKEFMFVANKSIENVINAANPYRKVLKVEYDFNVEKIEFKAQIPNEDLNTHSEIIKALNFAQNVLNAFQSFRNYVSGHNQENVLWWMYKLAKDNNMQANLKDDDSGFEIKMNQDFLNVLLMDAYGENYPIFHSDYLKSKLVTKNKTLNLNKI